MGFGKRFRWDWMGWDGMDDALRLHDGPVVTVSVCHLGKGD